MFDIPKPGDKLETDNGDVVKVKLYYVTLSLSLSLSDEQQGIAPSTSTDTDFNQGCEELLERIRNK